MNLRRFSWSDVARLLVIASALVAGVATSKSGPGPRHPVQAESNCGDVTFNVTDWRDGVLVLRGTFDAQMCPTIEPHARIAAGSATLMPSEITQPQRGTLTIMFKNSPTDVVVEIQLARDVAFAVQIRDGRPQSLRATSPFAH